MAWSKRWFATVFVGLVLNPLAHAATELKPDSVHVADTKKTKFYVRDGLIVGGDQAIDEVTVRNIRRAPNAGFERIVIDLDGNRNGESVAIPRAPYFQVSVTPDEQRIVVTVYGRPKLKFNAPQVLAAFRKSATVKSVQLLPRVEDNAWTFVLEMKAPHPVEVFELSGPTRVILDVQTRVAKR